MAAHDRIRLTGSLRKGPREIGAFSYRVHPLAGRLAARAFRGRGALRPRPLLGGHAPSGRGIGPIGYLPRVLYVALAFWLLVGGGVFLVALGGGPGALRARLDSETSLAKRLRAFRVHRGVRLWPRGADRRGDRQRPRQGAARPVRDHADARRGARSRQLFAHFVRDLPHAGRRLGCRPCRTGPRPRSLPPESPCPQRDRERPGARKRRHARRHLRRGAGHRRRQSSSRRWPAAERVWVARWRSPSSMPVVAGEVLVANRRVERHGGEQQGQVEQGVVKQCAGARRSGRAP